MRWKTDDFLYDAENTYQHFRWWFLLTSGKISAGAHARREENSYFSKNNVCIDKLYGTATGEFISVDDCPLPPYTIMFMPPSTPNLATKNIVFNWTRAALSIDLLSYAAMKNAKRMWGCATPKRKKKTRFSDVVTVHDYSQKSGEGKITCILPMLRVYGKSAQLHFRPPLTLRTCYVYLLTIIN